MATSESNLATVKLKTQSFGKGKSYVTSFYTQDCRPGYYCSSFYLVSRDYYLDHYYSILLRLEPQALQQYKKARENGEDQDSPKNAFPTVGYENLKIKSSERMGI